MAITQVGVSETESQPWSESRQLPEEAILRQREGVRKRKKMEGGREGKGREKGGELGERLSQIIQIKHNYVRGNQDLGVYSAIPHYTSWKL